MKIYRLSPLPPTLSWKSEYGSADFIASLSVAVAAGGLAGWLAGWMVSIRSNGALFAAVPDLLGAHFAAVPDLLGAHFPAVPDILGARFPAE